MILICHPQRGKTPSVLQIRIERKAVRFERQRGACSMNVHCPRKVMTQSVFETRPPARSPRRESSQGKKVGCVGETGIERTTTIKTDPLGIEFIEVMKDTAGGKALIVVQGMLEEADRA